MKIESESLYPPPFVPITITLETRKEATAMLHLAGCFNSPKECKIPDIESFADKIERTLRDEHSVPV